MCLGYHIHLRPTITPRSGRLHLLHRRNQTQRRRRLRINPFFTALTDIALSTRA